MYKCNTDTAILTQILRGNVKKKVKNSEMKSLNSFLSTQGSKSIRKFACHSLLFTGAFDHLIEYKSTF